MTDTGSKRHISTERLGVALCLAGAGLGAIGLLGWLIDRQQLLTIVPGYPVMVPNTSLSLIAIGVVGALRCELPLPRTRLLLSVTAALFVLMVAAGTLAEYALNIQTGLDQLIIATHEGPYPGRPSPPTASALAFLAIAVLLFDTRPMERLRPSEWCALAAGVIASTALLGQIFGVAPLFAFAGNLVRGMAVHTALGVLLLSWGFLLERPDAGLMKLVTSAGPGGILLRRLAPAAAIAPVSFAIASVRLMNVSDKTQIEFAFAALAVVSTLASFFLLSITAAHLNRAHETIARMQAETREIIDSASDAIFVSDLSGRFLDVNLAACRMVGYTREELLGKSVMDLHRPEDLPRLEEQRSSLVAGAVRVNEWELVCKDGTLLPVEVSAKILPDGRWEAFIRDITDRKRFERQQQFLVELGVALPATLDFNEALSNIVDFCVRDLADICIVDLLSDGEATLHRARVVCHNPANTALCDGLFGSHELGVLDGAGPVLFENLATSPAVPWGLNVEQVMALKRAGFRSALEIPLRARGHAMGRLVLITTGRRAFESRDLPVAEAFSTLAALSLDNKRLYRDAREASRARDEIIGYVAHDLRSPLQAISLTAYGLSRGKAADIEATGSDILVATQRMNRLIQDLLDITRIESRQFQLQSARLPVSELIRDIFESQKVMASAAKIEIRTAVANDLPDVLADRDRVLQVLENLVGNAIKFTKPGGSITLAAEAGHGEIVFSVTDTGSGIEAHDLPHVFDRFWQAADKKKRGTGLGLAIVKGIVEAHDGRVWVTSTVGKGSTFSFAIPAAPAGKMRDAHSSIKTARPTVTG
ncbi:MAG TPA: ATP-binding protein [Rhizomicrobium sp.]|nr:ATP-binding protein [Rhizomicrobium sp.]